MKHVFWGGLLLSAWLASGVHAASVSAGSDCAEDCCGPQMVQKTIRVPQWTTETKTVPVTRCRLEVRYRTETCMRNVPYTEYVTKECQIMVPERRFRTVTCMIPKPVYDTVEKTYTVCVPHRVPREGVRNVCRMEPVTIQRTTCVDRGHWETREVPAPHCWSCGNCGCDDCAKTITQRCWVPNLVTETKPVTVMRPKYHMEPYTYMATELRTEVRTKKVHACRHVLEPVTREVPYVVCVPKTVTKKVPVTRWRQEEQTRKVSYCVSVPYETQQTIHVPVCNWVEKTITVNANCGGDFVADCYADCGRGLFGRRRW